VLVLRSLAFNLVFFVGTAVALLVGLPVLLFPRRVLLWLARIWAHAVFGLLRLVCGLRYEVRGPRELLHQPVIVAAKHQSAWDTIVFLLIARDPAYVMKRELLLIPVYGWFSRKQQMIPIDREGGGAALRGVMRASERALRAGRQVVIFPQGTRVAPGAPAPYGPGTAALYTKLHHPVVPVALNSGLFWAKRSFLKRPGMIVVEVMPAIAPGLKRHDFSAELERRIEACTAKLEAEGRAPRG
jgi:1-acyl-sn-glycerol-3-phosphate acyltransferase